MVGLTRLSLRMPQFLAYLIVIISVVYTTNLLFFSPMAWLFSSIGNHLVAPGILGGYSHSGVYTNDNQSWNPDGGTPQLFSWISSNFTRQHGLGHPGPITVNERAILSKAFANSMRPSAVKPYFYRANGLFASDDITITTLITSNRFEVFARLVEKYRGPISVTVHVKDISEHVEDVLESLREMYTSSETMMKFVDVHLVIDAFDRQFNTWRNIARLFARTDFVMMLDIDFYPCTDFRAVIKQSSTILDKLRAGRAALVVPALEYVDFHEGTKYSSFPTKKSQLLSLVKKEHVVMFHASWSFGHNATDYKHFYAAPSGEVYKVTRYHHGYEPYVIFGKDGAPWCDERFVGYGGNKAACLFEMYLAGISYYVLADHFIIHQNHLYEENARENERRYNRKIYVDFREEACLKYLKMYHDNGLLGTDLAENALHECRKLKTVTRAVSKYFHGGP